MISLWKELTIKGILTANNIISIAKNWISRIGTDNYKKEYEKWTESPCNRDDLVNRTYWKRTNKMTRTSKDNNYSDSLSYAIGDTCRYG